MFYILLCIILSLPSFGKVNVDNYRCLIQLFNLKCSSRVSIVHNNKCLVHLPPPPPFLYVPNSSPPLPNTSFYPTIKHRPKKQCFVSFMEDNLGLVYFSYSVVPLKSFCTVHIISVLSQLTELIHVGVCDDFDAWSLPAFSNDLRDVSHLGMTFSILWCPLCWNF